MLILYFLRHMPLSFVTLQHNFQTYILMHDDEALLTEILLSYEKTTYIYLEKSFQSSHLLFGTNLKNLAM